ncbi:MAG: FCD domain-containing protein [Alphaproteobacteria bacterium]|jgi:DNA-binding GntR family transcriptional regulator|nr:FCD domain-containing protein [Alphaproteobacteria bacterium]
MSRHKRDDFREDAVPETLPDRPGAPTGEAAVEPLNALGESHQSLNDLVRTALRDAILSGRFRPGERLVEDRLARMFGVSRNPVREALKALHSEGIVAITPRRGATVARLSIEEAEEVIELRAALEGLSARLAARRLEPEAGERLSAILEAGDRAAAARDHAELNRLNDAFHGSLAEAGSNRYLVEFMRSLRAKTHWLFAAISQERALESWREHAAILRAVLDRDQEMAALLASRHVTSVGRELMDRKGPPGAEADADPAETDTADPADTADTAA